MREIGHEKFILTPIVSIIHGILNASESIAFGMESYPLATSIIQSTTLRLTGALEQKLKCICWEIGSFDYEFRYKHILREPLGECSSYEDKKKVFKNICKRFLDLGIDCRFDPNIKQSIISRVETDYASIIQDSAFHKWFESEVTEYLDAHVSLKIGDFVNSSKKGTPEFLAEKLRDEYENVVYRQRNRYAHNLMSYQQNVPTLSELSSNEFKRPNHFRIFAILILIDEIFMELFSRFLDYREAHVYN